MKVVWLPSAASALDREYDYLSAKNRSAARRVYSRLVAAVRHLGDFPQAGRVGQVEGTRELVVPGLPYLLIYRLNAGRVEILRVIHTATDWPEHLS